MFCIELDLGLQMSKSDERWSRCCETGNQLNGSKAGLKKPAGTGPVTAVTGLTGPDRFRYRAVRNRPKFKI